MSAPTDSPSVENPIVSAPPGEQEPAAPPPPQPENHDDFYMDWFERYLIAGFYCWFVVRIVDNYLDVGNVFNLFMIPSEGLVLVLLLFRRSSQAMTRQPLVWVLAFGAGLAPLLIAPGRLPGPIPREVGGVVMLMGIAIQVHAKIALGRSFGCVPAHRGLKLGGPYRFVRHPMYAGYLVYQLAVLSLNPSWWNLGVVGLCVGLMLPRLVLEERLLRADPLYREYQEKVRYRLIPGVF